MTRQLSWWLLYWHNSWWDLLWCTYRQLALYSLSLRTVRKTSIFQWIFKGHSNSGFDWWGKQDNFWWYGWGFSNRIWHKYHFLIWIHWLQEEEFSSSHKMNVYQSLQIIFWRLFLSYLHRFSLIKWFPQHWLRCKHGVNYFFWAFQGKECFPLLWFNRGYEFSLYID